MFAKYLKEHRFIVVFLLGSSIIGGFFNYQKLANYLLPTPVDPLVFSGVVCASRDPTTDCQKLNENFVGFVVKHAGTGIPVTLNLKFHKHESWIDPCNNGSVVEESRYLGGEQTTAFIFYSIDDVRLVNGNCMTRYNALIVPKIGLPIQILDQRQTEIEYIISGKYLVTTDLSGTMSHQIILTNP